MLPPLLCCEESPLDTAELLAADVVGAALLDAVVVPLLVAALVDELLVDAPVEVLLVGVALDEVDEPVESVEPVLAACAVEFAACSAKNPVATPAPTTTAVTATLIRFGNDIRFRCVFMGHTFPAGAVRWLD